MELSSTLAARQTDNDAATAAAASDPAKTSAGQLRECLCHQSVVDDGETALIKDVEAE